MGYGGSAGPTASPGLLLFLLLGFVVHLVLVDLLVVLVLGLLLGLFALVVGVLRGLVLLLLLLLLRFLLLALDRVLVGLHDLAVLDATAPALDGVRVEDGPGHHVTAEVAHLGPGAPALGLPDVAGLLEQALGVVLEHDQDAGQVGPDLVEGDRAVDVALLPLRAPHDALVRDLLEDRRLPRAVAEEDLRLEVDLVVVGRLDALDLLHEAGERAELGPLVVGDLDGDADVDRLHDVGRLGGLAATALVAPTAGDLVLEAGRRALQPAHYRVVALGGGLPGLGSGLADRA